jgi:hypothetical protein
MVDLELMKRMLFDGVTQEDLLNELNKEELVKEVLNLRKRVKYLETHGNGY